MDHSKFNAIRHFAFDVDGVLTDGRMLILENGDMVRQMHVRDGMALKHALDQGYTISIFTKGKSKGVRERLSLLGVQHIFDGLGEKDTIFATFLSDHNISWESTLYMGDDLPDVQLIVKCGVGACPADAAREVLQVADYISPVNGGNGCVRDVIERVLRLHGVWGQYTNGRVE